MFDCLITLILSFYLLGTFHDKVTQKQKEETAFPFSQNGKMQKCNLDDLLLLFMSEMIQA